MKNNKSSQNLDTDFNYIKYGGGHLFSCKYIILHIFCRRTNKPINNTIYFHPKTVLCITLVNVYVDLVVFTRVAGTS